MQLRKLGEVLGAEVGGVDAFGSLFGELDPPGPDPYGRPFLPAHPEMNVISNIRRDGVPRPAHK